MENLNVRGSPSLLTSSEKHGDVEIVIQIVADFELWGSSAGVTPFKRSKPLG
jgi:hypothetical protein